MKLFLAKGFITLSICAALFNSTVVIADEDAAKPLTRFEAMCAVLAPDVVGATANIVVWARKYQKTIFSDFDTFFDVPREKVNPNNDNFLGPRIHIAYNAGIISGYDDGTLKPDELMTREDLAVIAYRIVWAEDDFGFPIDDENLQPDLKYLNTYSDCDDVSQYCSCTFIGNYKSRLYAS